MRQVDRDESVFFNCPYDAEYRPIFDAIVFSVMFAGYRVRCATERSDGGEQRLTKIIDLIGGSRFSIHDLSRQGLDKTSGLPRFNMPIEIGIALGAKFLGNEEQQTHMMLILDRAQYRHQKSASDLAGTDPRSHSGKPREAIVQVRDFLSDSGTRGPLPGGEYFIGLYNVFREAMPTILERRKLAKDQLTFKDQLRVIEDFIDSQATEGVSR